MGSHPTDRETEIKLRIRDAAEGHRRFSNAGFHLARPRVFEANTVFDTAEGGLRGAGCLLRIREVDGRGLLTYKGPAAAGRHKSREEIETPFDVPAAMSSILDRLGYRTAFRYEKYRTEYTDGEGTGTVDETPIGCFLEIEGAPDWIDRTAGALGFAETDYVTGSYGRLYAEYCAANAFAPGDMVFGAATESTERTL